jgi:hypothetical protein
MLVFKQSHTNARRPTQRWLHRPGMQFLVKEKSHCQGGTRVRGEWTPGFATAARDASKRRAYRQVPSDLPFGPMSGESFGRLGARP